MKSKEICSKLEEFVNGSDSFIGFTFQGCYDMGTKSFLAAFHYYLETGENKLDEHSEIRWLSWKPSFKEDKYFDEKKRKEIKAILKNEGYWNVDAFVSEERKEEIKRDIIISEYKDEEEKSYKKRRRKATTYTSKKSVRDAVFEIHGKSCNHCGSEENISLDHMVPVAAGGEDRIDNLQPLCKTCNSSKGSKTKG